MGGKVFQVVETISTTRTTFLHDFVVLLLVIIFLDGDVTLLKLVLHLIEGSQKLPPILTKKIL